MLASNFDNYQTQNTDSEDELNFLGQVLDEIETFFKTYFFYLSHKANTAL